MHGDVLTTAEEGITAFARKPLVDEARAPGWDDLPAASPAPTIVRTVDDPCQPDGGIRIPAGNLGRACVKISAVERERWMIEAPARVFHDQAEVLAAFKAGELERDVVIVVRLQDPRANGMPELHKLTPPLGALQNRGFKVALVTDGRMSGARERCPPRSIARPRRWAAVRSRACATAT